MLGLVFVCISFFSSAYSGESTNAFLLVKEEVCKTPRPLPALYTVTYTCGSTTYVVCCFDYYIAAYLYLQNNPAATYCANASQP